jgi:peptidyl-tRNA hydrolase, PTH1 family
VTWMKPATFMNASGEAVGSWLRYYKEGLASLVVVVDDADLPLGRIRIRARGGSGGHNGLRSIIQHAGGENFARVRLGIGRDASRGDMISHVLRPFSKEDAAVVADMVARAADAAAMIVTEGIERAMNCYNQAVAQEQEMES